ncbi:hypothetical protein [Lactobacillus bombicola]
MAYIVYFTWSNYRKLQNLKQNMDNDPNIILQEYDDQIAELKDKIATMDKFISKYRELPPSLTINRSIKKNSKQREKLSSKLESLQDKKDQFIKILEDYRAGKVDKQMLNQWLHDN